ncbi:Der GTPase-activating protein YihI [Aliidiomarina soli]|uniref:Der GTPase-activating protein YihI n=1 Tax=Aliidiomarina soli TaxID=1928574 RepID=A0A432WJ09_9GAMM|nr:Der GTPase-activating protein YihI [Aliidiomarina soli]RUO33701.1 hypothetical protein CWE14_04345 [Aliidiomarina soli]
MTRRKKTRKQGPLGVKSQPKNLREHGATDNSKKPQRSKGKPAGNRHAEGAAKSPAATAASRQNDPRVGSKRKIPLNAASPAPVTAKKAAAEPLSPEQEFAALEENERLQTLLAKLDDGKALTAEDQQWVDRQLTRYRALAEKLGIDLEDDDDDSDDDLEPWQRFENPKDWV